MASFKGIKERINSIKTTRKITSAMKMVSSARLHRAQKAITNMLPYSNALERILANLLAAEGPLPGAALSPLTAVREVDKVALIVFASDGSFAGSFNSNVVRELKAAVQGYALHPDNLQIYTIGKKVFEGAVKCGYDVEENFEALASKPEYDTVAALADKLTAEFLSGRLDKVEVIYHHFKSAGAQVLTRETFLPIEVSQTASTRSAADYIFEPSRDLIMKDLLPLSLRLRLYTILLDSNASEHAARIIAMQTATENADTLINELTIEYNKSRQYAITNELLDMVGGQMK